MRTSRPADGHVLSNGRRRNRSLACTFLTVLGESETLFEDPPETPAPMFAVRAFKSAIFGTPHPAQPASPSNRSRKALFQNSLPQASALLPEPLKIVHLESTDRENVTKNLDFEPLVSPTKGILLTPGTGTTRRKNVTFRGIGSDEKSKAKDISRANLLGDTISDASLSRSHAAGLMENQPRQTSLTKALYKAKNGVSENHTNPSLSASKPKKNPALDRAKDRPVTVVEREWYDHDVVADVTIDLSNPQSRSGQHWKAEFEQYHRKSDREMKKIIKANQNVKSFAVKKDSEASDLSEKWRRELSRVAAMESKVTDLATQLAATRTQDSRETPDQTKLVNDLARQTALAIRYKEKADNYKVALMKKRIKLAPETDRFEDVSPQDTGAESNQRKLDFTLKEHESQEMATLRSELDRFRNSAEAAEEKAAKLETENLALQAAIDRLRQEMKTSELKRQAKEESFQRREEVLKASKADCDAQLLALLSKNEALLQDVQRHRTDPPTSECKIIKEHKEISSSEIPWDKAGAGQATGGQDHSTPRKHANKHRPELSMVDIWILEGQDSALSPEKPPKKHDQVERPPEVLKEIAQNPVREDENRKPYRTTQGSAPLIENPPPSKVQPAYESPRSSTLISPNKLPTSGAKRVPTRRSTNNSPHPSMLNPASGPPDAVSSTYHSAHQLTNSDRQKQEQQEKQQPKAPLSALTQTKSALGQATDLVPVAAPTATGTQGREDLEMPPPADRKEAMRARAAQRMAERRRAREGMGKEA